MSIRKSLLETRFDLGLFKPMNRRRSSSAVASMKSPTDFVGNALTVEDILSMEE